MGFRTHTKMYHSQIQYIFDEKIVKNVLDSGPIQKCIGPKSDTFLTKKSPKMYGIPDPYKNVSVPNPIHFWRKNRQKCIGFRTHTKMYRSQIRYIFDEKIAKNVWDSGPIQKCIGPKSDTFLAKKSPKMYGIPDPYKNVSVPNPIHFCRKSRQKCLGFRTDTKMYRSQIRYIFGEKIAKNVCDSGPIQ